MVKGFHTLIGEVDDMEKAAAFYRDVLKLQNDFASPHWSSFSAGGDRIGLHPPFGAGSGSGWVLCVVVEDIRALRKVLEEAGHVPGDYHETPAGVAMDFADPAGNRLQAMQVGAKVADLQ